MPRVKCGIVKPIARECRLKKDLETCRNQHWEPKGYAQNAPRSFTILTAHQLNARNADTTICPKISRNGATSRGRHERSQAHERSFVVTHGYSRSGRGILFAIEMAIIILRKIFLRNLIRGSSVFWFYFDLYVTTLFEVILVGVAVVAPLAAISRYLKSREDKNSD